VDVDMHELEERLAEYVERAARGESIRVMEHGRPKALLGPVPTIVELAPGLGDGGVTPRTGAPLSAITRAKGRRSIREVLDEDRGE